MIPSLKVSLTFRFSCVLGSAVTPDRLGHLYPLHDRPGDSTSSWQSSPGPNVIDRSRRRFVGFAWRTSGIGYLFPHEHGARWQEDKRSRAAFVDGVYPAGQRRRLGLALVDGGSDDDILVSPRTSRTQGI